MAASPAGDGAPAAEPADRTARYETCSLPALEVSVSAARAFVRGRLAGWGLGPELCDNAELVVSELFTNAVVHTDSVEVVCRLRLVSDGVHLAVVDQGCGLLGAPVCAPAEAEHGRGLLIVGMLARRWGVSTAAGSGRTVWALLCSEEAEHRA